MNIAPMNIAPMTIGLSALFLKPTQVGGAEFMLRGLLLGLLQIPDVTVYLFLPDTAVAWAESIQADIGPERGAALRVIPVVLRGNRFVSEALDLPRQVRRLGLDGLIYPNYFTPLRGLRDYPVLTVIHDLNYAHFPQFFSWKKRLWLNVAHRLTLANADVTVTVSEFVRRDVQRVYGASADRIVAVPNAILWSRFEAIASQPESAPSAIPPHAPFILSVANHYPHKNLRPLLQAMAQLPPDLDTVHLVLVGQLPDALVGLRRDRCDDIAALARELGLQDRIHVTGYIGDPELAWYYRHAAVFAFPSLFEGFGMPPVEALGLGLPVLTTRCTAIPEATLGLAQYVEQPTDAATWATRLTQILRTPQEFRPTATEIAQIRATYSPDAIARQFLTHLRS
jgi:glycosyltransferase involved in cell wall biosynthesis